MPEMYLTRYLEMRGLTFAPDPPDAPPINVRAFLRLLQSSRGRRVRRSESARKTVEKPVRPKVTFWP